MAMTIDQRQAGDEGKKEKGVSQFEITPEMMRAAVAAYWTWERSDDYRVENLVTQIIRAATSLDKNSL